jgi:hypothetical protein
MACCMARRRKIAAAGGHGFAVLDMRQIVLRRAIFSSCYLELAAVWHVHKAPYHFLGMYHCFIDIPSSPQKAH